MKKNAAKKSQPEATSSAHHQLAFEQAVSQRAYQIWEDCGCPHGHDAAHWLQAERDVLVKNNKPK
jgi:hypothetical protein